MIRGFSEVKPFLLKQQEKIQTGDRNQQIEAITDLGRFSKRSQIFFGARAIRMIAEATRAPQVTPFVRSFAMESLVELAHQPEYFLEEIVREHPDVAAQREAAHWLVHLATKQNNKKAIQSLKRLRFHPDNSVRKMAIWNTASHNNLLDNLHFWLTGRWPGMEQKVKK